MLEVLIGVLGGVLIGSTGAGAGSVVTPLLIAIGYQPLVAINTGLATLTASKLIGAALHRRLGHWPEHNATVILFGGIAGSIIAALFTRLYLVHSPHADAFLKVFLAVILMLGATCIALEHRKKREDDFHLERRPLLLFAIGLLMGLTVGITAIGSGALLGAVLYLTTSWRVPQLAAVSNLFGLVVGALSLMAHFNLGFNGHLMTLTLAGLIPGVVAGTYLSRKIHRPWFGAGIAVLSLVLAVDMVYSAFK